MANINELKELVAAWQKIEDDGGSPTSAGKLAGAKAALAEAEAAAKPAKKAKKAKKVKEVVKEVAADEEE